MATLTRNGLRARVFASLRACGHVGHLVELLRRYDTAGPYGPTSLVFDDELPDAILLLRSAQEVIDREVRLAEPGDADDLFDPNDAFPADRG